MYVCVFICLHVYIFTCLSVYSNIYIICINCIICIICIILLSLYYLELLFELMLLSELDLYYYIIILFYCYIIILFYCYLYFILYLILLLILVPHFFAKVGHLVTHWGTIFESVKSDPLSASLNINTFGLILAFLSIT